MFMNLLAGTNSILELSVWEWVIGSILIVASIVIILVVLLQEGRQANVGVISGAADSFMEKGAAKTLDEKLSKWTKVIAFAFFALVLTGMLVTTFLSNESIMKRNAAASTTTSSTTAATTTTTKDASVNGGAANDGSFENWD